MAYTERFFDPGRKSCEECQAVYKKGHLNPPCDECMPPLDPDNVAAFRVYAFVRGQYIVAGMGDVIDINFDAVESAMRRFNETDDDTFFKVGGVARHMIQIENERARAKHGI